MPKFAFVPTSLTKKIRIAQLQTFDRIANDDILALKKLKERLFEHPLLALLSSHGNVTAEPDPRDKQIGFSFNRNNQTEQTDQLNDRHARLTTPSGHTIQPTEIV